MVSVARSDPSSRGSNPGPHPPPSLLSPHTILSVIICLIDFSPSGSCEINKEHYLFTYEHHLFTYELTNKHTSGRFEE